MKLPLFEKWQHRCGQSDATPWEDLSDQMGLQNVLLASTLFAPETVVIDGRVFLKENANAEAFASLASAGYDRATQQKLVNHVHLESLFFRDSGGSPSDFALFERLLEALKGCWAGVLAARYPDHTFYVETQADPENFELIILFFQD